ncbi:SusC/RagA family TonB-linked outer membrane protein [Portibacter marinus]|uniref:SusC/RagA family TonB-linked outer membrane protein n=1 Tax=Portibacter marinus TaxID=2898660 RepID=UPI001F1D9AC1|nr:TonB-dependent receptor [Portibacter marinus]
MHAQTTVSGVVTDNSGEPLIGATVLEQNTNNGTVTDIDGTYSISVGNNATLVFTYVGYREQEIAVDGQSNINVSLTLDAAQLAEVVVTGYGSQKKSNLTGSVGVVDAATIEARPITSASQALQGQVSGVWINQASGEPGQDGATIRIRGIGTLNNPNPLVLVDGIEAPFDSVDPNDIASITVLKDAASAAIYGSRAANGVVLVTTKRGKKNSKPVFNYTGYGGTSEVNSTPGYIWDTQEFMELRNEADVNSGNQPLYPQEIINKYSGSNAPNTNWFDAILKPGRIQQHSLSARGGSENTNFNISIGYLENQGVVTGVQGTERYNARLNLDTDVTDKFGMGGSFYISRQVSDLDNVGQDGGVLARATRLGPNFPAYTDDGRIADRARDLDAIELSTPNILAEVLALNRLLKENTFLGNFYAEYEPIQNLTVRGTFAANYIQNNNRFFNRRIETFDHETGDLGLIWLENRNLTLQSRERLQLTSWLQATYEKSIGANNFKVILGANQESYNDQQFQASRSELPSNSLAALDTGNPETSTNGDFVGQWAMRSIFGRINYDFLNKYLFEVNVRRDGSSRFGSNNRWATFPSFSAGWVISEEPFFNSTVIDFFKIRASWGQLGNQNIGNYPFASAISFSPAYSFGGQIVGAAAQTSLGNPDIRWETTTQSDLGVNMSLLNGKVSIEGDYFIRNASDILFNQNNPGVTGVRSPTTVNIAEVRNTGWEASVNYRENINKFGFNIGGNVTNVRSEVLSIDPSLAGDADRVIQGQFIIQRGAPINALYGLNAVGIFNTQAEIEAAPDQSAFGTPTPGDLQYEDFNNDGVITADDRHVLGQDNPTWLYGINMGANFANFDIAAIFQGIADAQTFETGRFYAPFANSGGASVIWRDRWTPENTDASLPKIRIAQGGVNNNVNHSWFINERSYFRLKNLQIGYNLPQSMLDNNFMESLRIYVNGTNLLTWTNFIGFDPEQEPRTTNGTAIYPQLRIITGGINLRF